MVIVLPAWWCVHGLVTGVTSYNTIYNTIKYIIASRYSIIVSEQSICAPVLVATNDHMNIVLSVAVLFLIFCGWSCYSQQCIIITIVYEVCGAVVSLCVVGSLTISNILWLALLFPAVDYYHYDSLS